MNFTSALAAVFNNNDRVTRHAWNSRSIYVLLDDEKLCIHGYDASQPDDGKNHPLIVSDQDYFADDWEIVTDG